MELSEKIKILKDCSLFKGLSDSNIEAIANLTKEYTYPPKTIFIEQDNQPDKIYFIGTGLVRAYKTNSDGDEIHLNVLGPGDTVGEMAIVDNEPRSACVETLQETVLLSLTRIEFKKLLYSHPEISLHLLKILSQRIRSNANRIETIATENLIARTWGNIQILVKYFPNKTIPLSQEELATLVGATRARITEALHHLVKEGKVILSHRSIQIK